MKNTWISLSASAVMLLMASCGGKTIYPKYYALEIPPPPARAANGARFPGTVAVRSFDTAPYLRRGRIVYREAPEEIAFYEYRRWADDPAERVTTAVIDSLRASGLFSSVKRYDGQNQQDYLMVGRVEKLEEVDYGGAVAVTAKLSGELVDLHSGVTEWSGDAAETLKIDERNINAVVVELSQALRTSINRLLTSLEQQPHASNR